MTFIFFIESKGILDPGLIENLAERVRREKRELEEYSQYGTPWPLSVITYAASLTHNGPLRSLEDIWLCDEDLTSVPAEHLASLASSVTGRVDITNSCDCGSGLVTFLDNVKSEQLVIRQNLNSEETQALMRAMESRVREVQLDKGVTLYTD